MLFVAVMLSPPQLSWPGDSRLGLPDWHLGVLVVLILCCCCLAADGEEIPWCCQVKCKQSSRHQSGVIEVHLLLRSLVTMGEAD